MVSPLWLSLLPSTEQPVKTQKEAKTSEYNKQRIFYRFFPNQQVKVHKDFRNGRFGRENLFTPLTLHPSFIHCTGMKKRIFGPKIHKYHHMKSTILVTAIFFLLLINPLPAQVSPVAAKSQPNQANEALFDRWFENKTLRVDYLLAGDATTETGFFVQMKEEPYYGGPHRNMNDPFGYGSYRYVVKDSASATVIFTRGFNSLFQEWQGTPEAKVLRRAYPMTAILPFPKRTVLFRVERRELSTNQFVPILERYISPGDYFIIREKVTPVEFTLITDNGSPVTHVDVAFIAEGYTATEMEKFRADARRMANYFLSMAPYNEMADRFNFYALAAPSVESGVTIPGKKQWVSTNIRSSFYTFDMERYLTTSETRAMYDIAANVPYDMVFVLVNSKQYGGGGFYNHYGQSTVDHPQSTIVALHEFGHQFAGLADEYYTSAVTYSDFYNLAFEPWEPNITTNVDFQSKWQQMITPGVPIPTPRTEAYKNVTGMFEGGGYLSKGIFSPAMDCRMKTNEAPGFCPVCQEAIRKMIRFYTE